MLFYNDLFKTIRTSKCMTLEQIGKAMGVSKQTVQKWEVGIAKPRPSNIYAIAKLFGISVIDISDLKPEKELLMGLEKKECYSSEVKKPEGKLLMLPVISMTAAAEVNTAIYPIADWATDNCEERQSFRLGKEGDIVLEVVGDSMLPWYPEHTRLLCRPCRPRIGDRVVAVLKDGEVIFKIYVEGKTKFGFKSINKDVGIELSYAKTDYSSVRDIYVVVESVRDERALDTAMKHAGINHFWEKELKALD